MSVHGKCYDVGTDSTNCHRARTRGSRPLKKKGTENNENRFTSSVRQRCAQRRRLAQDRDNTEYILSGEATTLNTSWMEQNPRHALAALEKMIVPQTARHWRTRSCGCHITLREEYLCRDPNAVVLKHALNNTLATKALAQTFISSAFSLVSNHLEIHRGSKFHVMRSQNSLKIGRGAESRIHE